VRGASSAAFALGIGALVPFDYSLDHRLWGGGRRGGRPFLPWLRSAGAGVAAAGLIAENRSSPWRGSARSFGLL